MATVTVIRGTYANKPVLNQTFELVKAHSVGSRGMYVTVDGSKLTGQPGRSSRILIDDEQCVEYDGVVDSQAPAKPARPTETDEEAKERIRRRFEIINEMSEAVTAGIVRGLIISGPPGVGKSYGVEQILDLYEMENQLAGRRRTIETVKGSATAIGLYKTLYDCREAGDVVVFDDCDAVLFDERCLNLLKGVLDSGKKRTISWKAESNALKTDDIPDRFDFYGAVIFITNVDFENIRNKRLAPHLAALMSRCHYIDLEMDTDRDCFLRIDQIVGDGMLSEYNFGPEGDQEVVEFMKTHRARLRELSLRTVLKIADLRAMAPTKWRELADATCLKRGF